MQVGMIASFWRVMIMMGCVLAVAGGVAAEAVSVRLSVDQQPLAVNRPAELRVQVHGTQRAAPPQIRLDAFHVQYLGPSTQISVVNGAVSSSVTHLYTLVSQREGTFTIGPLEIDVDGVVYTTNTIEVRVVSASAASPAQRASGAGPSAGGATSLDDALQFALSADHAQAYLNQAIPMKLQLLIGNITVRGIEMPKLEADGFLVEPLAQPRQSRVMIDEQRYTLLEFLTTVVPIKTGLQRLGPASISCQVIEQQQRRRHSFPMFEGNSLFSEFFGTARRIAVTVRAEAVPVEILPLPEAGQPEDFNGAVGQFTLTTEAVPTATQAGEPITLTMTVRGSGNFESVHPPTLVGDLRQFKVYEPQQQNGAAGSAPQQREFEQILIPLDPSVTELPGTQFSFFDPELGVYRTVTKEPIAVRIEAARVEAPLVVSGPSMTPEVLGRDIIYIKEELGPLQGAGWVWHRSWGWWAWLLAPVLLWCASEWERRRRWRLAADPVAARASGALKRSMARCEQARQLQQQGQANECSEELFRALQQYLGDRFNVPSEGLTKAELRSTLRPRHIPEALLCELEELFDRCDAARYTPVAVTAAHLEETLHKMESVLAQLEQWKPV